MYKKIFSLFVFLFFFFFPFGGFASGPPGPPTGPPPCWPPPCTIPVDSGIGFLIAAGIALGVKKLYALHKTSQSE